MSRRLKEDSGDWSAIATVSAGAVMISFSSVFVKLTDVGPIAAGFYRVFFGALLLIPLAFFFRQRCSFGWRNVALACCSGMVFALDLTVWHKSIHGVGPGLATVLANFQVFVLAGFGVVILKEHVTRWTYMALAVGVAGLLLLVGPGWADVSPMWKAGVIYGLITAVVYATYILALRRLQSGADNGAQVWNMALISAVAAVVMAGEVLASGETFGIPNDKSLMALIAYGFLGQTLGWYLISRGLPLLKVSVSGVIVLLQPFLAFVWDIVLFARPTTCFDLIGAFLALAAIYLVVQDR